MLQSGNHTIPIKCQDIAGNTASAEASVNMIIHEKAPEVIKAYFKDNTLRILTDEPATCKYTSNQTLGCDFNFDDKNLTVMNASGNYHSVIWSNFGSYYIKCSDSYNNTNVACAFIARTY